MKTSAKSPVAEPVKLCIELDTEMQKQWRYTKEDLEQIFKRLYEKSVNVTNNVILRCLLYCYIEGDGDISPLNFAYSSSNEEVEQMS